MNKKLNNSLLIILIIIVVFLVSYLIWTFLFKEDKSISEEKNLVTLVYNDNLNDQIDLRNAFALTDEEGAELDPYEFSVNNNGKSSIKYSVYLEKISPKLVNDGCNESMLLQFNQLKVTLKNNDSKEDASLLSDIDGVLIKEKKLSSSGKDNYQFKIWVTEKNADDFSWMGKHFHFRLKIKIIK